MRIGHGWDLHRLEEGLPLVIGGVAIPFEKGCVAHSDGDVLIHAVIDALLGAAALGNIGKLFPDNDPRYRGADSRALLRQTVSLLPSRWRIANIDTTVVLQAPKLNPFTDAIRANLAADLQIDIEAVSVKPKTHEKVDSVGRGEAVEAYAVVLLESAES